MNIKEAIVGAIKTVVDAIRDNNVKGTTYPDDKSTYQDYTNKDKK